jgi:hypothetical protein
MKTRWVMATCMTLLFAFAGSAVLSQDRAPDRNDQKLSQNRKRQNHTKFDDYDLQVMRDWYNQPRGKVLAGLRDENRGTPDVDARFQIGSAQDAYLRTNPHPAPIEFWHRLTSSPRSYQYVAIQGHVAAIDDNYQDVNDLIHLKLDF